MTNLDEKEIACPYCGETIGILIDPSVPHQNYIEDCQVCCQPIIFDVTVDMQGNAVVAVFSESE